jgi:hypothetical protein
MCVCVDVCVCVCVCITPTPTSPTQPRPVVPKVSIAYTSCSSSLSPKSGPLTMGTDLPACIRYGSILCPYTTTKLYTKQLSSQIQFSVLCPWRFRTHFWYNCFSCLHDGHYLPACIRYTSILCPYTTTKLYTKQLLSKTPFSTA